MKISDTSNQASIDFLDRCLSTLGNNTVTLSLCSMFRPQGKFVSYIFPDTKVAVDFVSRTRALDSYLDHNAIPNPKASRAPLRSLDFLISLRNFFGEPFIELVKEKATPVPIDSMYLEDILLEAIVEGSRLLVGSEIFNSTAFHDIISGNSERIIYEEGDDPQFPNVGTLCPADKTAIDRAPVFIEFVLSNADKSQLPSDTLYIFKNGSCSCALYEPKVSTEPETNKALVGFIMAHHIESETVQAVTLI